VLVLVHTELDVRMVGQADELIGQVLYLVERCGSGIRVLLCGHNVLMLSKRSACIVACILGSCYDWAHSWRPNSYYVSVLKGLYQEWLQMMENNLIGMLRFSPSRLKDGESATMVLEVGD
jgi:hypothetical protein